MKPTKSTDPRVRCKLCPRAMRYSEYAEHFGKFHAFNFSTGERVPYAEPAFEGARPSKAARREHGDIEGQLFIGYPTAPTPQED